MAMTCLQARATEEGLFNAYILKAVEDLALSRAGLGYGPAAYTRDLRLAGRIVKASRPPLTMCVAAQVEVIAKALEIYESDTKDRSYRSFVPLTQWKSLRPHSLRGKIWIVEKSGSSGTASALETFGMGEQMPFEALKPGAFLNLNRERTGHAVIFLSYLDSSGEPMQQYSDKVAGFKYFSSQGSPENGGFGYRYAFFSDAGCPKLAEGKKRDCGVIRSSNQRFLNTGHMLAPKHWNSKRRDQALAVFNATKSIGGEGAFDPMYFDGKTTDD